MTDREKALKRVQMYTFACLEANLFLDTHPNDKQALDYLRAMKAMLEKARKEFTEKYGMLSPADIADDADSWDWVNSPWPWQSQGDDE